jgi:hypothetical protein
MFTYYKLGPHVSELEQRPCVLGVSRPIVIKWLKPGWRDEWDEVVRRMDAGGRGRRGVRRGNHRGRCVGHGEGSYRSLWSRLSRSYSYDIAPKSPMCQIKNEAMAMTTHTADAATAPFFLSFSPTNRVAVK